MKEIEFHSVYYLPLAPQELIDMHPFHAIHGNLALFVTSAKNPPGVVDLKSMPFNHPYVDGNPGITAAQLDGIVDGLLSDKTPFTSDEVQIGLKMSDYIYETRFKPVAETEI